MIDLALFFAAIRETMFHPITAEQVEGIETILTAWGDGNDLRFMAYSLGTAYHETGRKMQPVREIGEGRRRAYGHPIGPWRQAYYGRGDVQLTWEHNYRHATKRLQASGVLRSDEDLEMTPDLALKPAIAAALLIHGMLEGWFTGKRLAQFFTSTRSDWTNARTIINGHDRAHLIGGYGLHFFHALDHATLQDKEVL